MFPTRMQARPGDARRPAWTRPAAPARRGRRLLSLTPVLAALALAGCGNHATFDSIQDVRFEEHVQPVLNRNCTTSGCHNATDLASGLSLTSYAELAAGSIDGTMVVPFEAERSHLVQHITGATEPRMPPTGQPLPDDLVRMVARWIDDGARDETGTVMYSDVRSKAFVACQGENAVAVVDMETGRLARLINVEAPHSVYVHDDKLYVSRFETASDNIHVYDPDTYELLQTGRAGTFPALMQATPDGTQLWVTNFDESTGDNNIYILDPESLEVVQTLNFGGTLPHGLAMTEDGSKIFITNIGSDDIDVINGNSDPSAITGFRLPLTNDTVTHQPQQCILSADEAYLFVGALKSNQVFVYDVAAEQFVASVTVGDAPWHLTLAPNGTEVWVANWHGNSVSIVDVSDPETPTVTETLAPQHEMPMGRVVDDHPILVQPIGIITGPDDRIYIACANNDELSSGHHPTPGGEKAPGFLVVYEPATRQLLSTAEVPNFARYTSFRY